VDIRSPDPIPVVEQCLAITRVPGDQSHLSKTLEIVETLPARARGQPERHAVEGLAEMVSCARFLPVRLDLAHHLKVTLATRFTVQDTQDMDHGHVLFVAAGIVDPDACLQKCVADKVGRTERAIERRAVARVLVPHPKAQHTMVVAPKVPLPEESLVFSKRPDVPIVGLKRDELGDQIAQHGVEARIVGHTPCLHGRD